jgi:hypothetical protein
MKKAKEISNRLVATAIAAWGFDSPKGHADNGANQQTRSLSNPEGTISQCEKWSISSVIFLNTFATTVTCPAELLIENPMLSRGSRDLPGKSTNWQPEILLKMKAARLNKVQTA